MRFLVQLTLLVGALASAAPVFAASFDLVYDDTPDGIIGNGSIVGTGTVRYDGPATPGSFALDSLSGFAFDATVRGVTFTTANLQTNLSLSGISVFSLAGGGFGLVFTGSGGFLTGSLDLGGVGAVLSHEPTSAIGNGIGCCGGDGAVNRYVFLQSNNRPGDYSATAIPEPASAGLLAMGLLGLAMVRRPVAQAPMNIRNWSRLATRRKGFVRFSSPSLPHGSAE